MSLKGNGQVDRIFMILKTKNDTRVVFYFLPCHGDNCLRAYITIIVKYIYRYISQCSGDRLQDHWSNISQTA